MLNRRRVKQFGGGKNLPECSKQNISKWDFNK